MISLLVPIGSNLFTAEKKASGRLHLPPCFIVFIIVVVVVLIIIIIII